MKLNDSISTYDVAEALQGETGKFEVTSPNGERYFVTCQPGHSPGTPLLAWSGPVLSRTCNPFSCAK
jgi:hypothetical protein